jgi:hypothetical protein
MSFPEWEFSYSSDLKGRGGLDHAPNAPRGSRAPSSPPTRERDAVSTFGDINDEALARVTGLSRAQERHRVPTLPSVRKAAQSSPAGPAVL